MDDIDVYFVYRERSVGKNEIQAGKAATVCLYTGAQYLVTVVYKVNSLRGM